MFNPFDLPGPQFLLFYACLGIAVVLVLRTLRSRREDGPPPHIDTSDPYLVAYLRGGANEAARVAAVSLIDRGILKESGDDRLASSNRKAVRRPIEKALVELFARPQPVAAMFGAAAVNAACGEYNEQLSRLGLLPDGAARAERRRLYLAALAILLGAAAIKIAIALARGRTNIEFLIVGAIVFAIVCWKVVNRPRTTRGDVLITDLQRLFSRLKDRSATLMPGGANADAVLLAAVFGVSALPAGAFAQAHRLFKKSSSGGSDSGSSGSCGSSCGSSSGSSSCGGGGGGCGGCGGGGD